MERSNVKCIAGRKGQLGQGMTEYIIIVALVAVGAIGVYNLLGKTVRDQTSAIACGMAGNQGCSTTQSTSAGTDATTAQTQADQTQGLTNFGQNSRNQ
jgi:Flp pilus assembly pilin Flp